MSLSQRLLCLLCTASTQSWITYPKRRFKDRPSLAYVSCPSSAGYTLEEPHSKPSSKWTVWGIAQTAASCFTDVQFGKRFPEKGRLPFDLMNSLKMLWWERCSNVLTETGTTESKALWMTDRAQRTGRKLVWLSRQDNSFLQIFIETVSTLYPKGRPLLFLFQYPTFSRYSSKPGIRATLATRLLSRFLSTSGGGT